eukprot:scaffold154539_cov24-Tisochrysis_lutea.AAC.4
MASSTKSLPGTCASQASRMPSQPANHGATSRREPLNLAATITCSRHRRAPSTCHRISRARHARSAAASDGAPARTVSLCAASNSKAARASPPNARLARSSSSAEGSSPDGLSWVKLCRIEAHRPDFLRAGSGNSRSGACDSGSSASRSGSGAGSSALSNSSPKRTLLRCSSAGSVSGGVSSSVAGGGAGSALPAIATSSSFTIATHSFTSSISVWAASSASVGAVSTASVHDASRLSASSMRTRACGISAVSSATAWCCAASAAAPSATAASEASTATSRPLAIGTHTVRSKRASLESVDSRCCQ